MCACVRACVCVCVCVFQQCDAFALGYSVSMFEERSRDLDMKPTMDTYDGIKDIDKETAGLDSPAFTGTAEASFSSSVNTADTAGLLQNTEDTVVSEVE